ncbi:MAG: hypothetical protein ABSG86_12600 [Thermoguttaceae bacterium]|jgi:hypothetical protein
MEWLISEVFGPAKTIGDWLAGARNDEEALAGIPLSILSGGIVRGAPYTATKSYVFRAHCQEPLAQMIDGLKRADQELANLPPDVTTEIRNLQQIVNGSVGTISLHEDAMYYVGSDIGEYGRRGWSAVIRNLKGVPFPLAEAEPKASEPTSPVPDQATTPSKQPEENVPEPLPRTDAEADSAKDTLAEPTKDSPDEATEQPTVAAPTKGTPVVADAVAMSQKLDRSDTASDSKKVLPPKMPEGTDVRDLVQRLQVELPKGKSQSQIAREFTGETADSDPKAQSLLRQARRYRHLWDASDS